MVDAKKIEGAVKGVKDQKSFIKNLLIDTLGWQIPQGVEQIEDISFGWTQEELGVNDLDGHLIDGQIYQIRPMSENQPWGIFILEFRNEDVFTTGRGLTGPLRKVLRGLVPKRRRQVNLQSWDRENLLFICTHNYQHYRFAYFKAPEEKTHAAPLTTFGWEPDTPARTACEHNLIHLTWPDEPEDSDQWINHWAKAFDVESVTKKFYDAYEQMFTNLQAQLDLPSDEDKKMFAQVLMNRLMFLRFVERKGWLRFGNSNPKEYLKNLYQAGRLNNLSWYRSRLQVLFFEGLAVPNHNRENVIGSVPYLNGGLFTLTEWDERAGDIADEVFEPILGQNGLLYRYNFTVEESTPLDIDVAVDPEMLGKVFEKLVTARHQSGSYYTPRTVVQFMCREALKGYLGSQYAPLIDEHKTEDISVPQARKLLEKLDNIKVVDPACGSGAYLLGMLQELFALTKILDTRAQTDDPHNAYHRKLQIIQNNIYGVDLDEFAVSIARLRLWLSLAVDFEGDQPDPLPNLDFKIEDGDSLTAPDPSASGQLDLFRQERIRQFDALKAEFMDPRRRAEHPDITDEIDRLREEIASFMHPNQQIRGFDWRVEFAEVWSQKNGFDIAIANPPYGITIDDLVRNQYFNQRSQTEKGQSKDSYGIFVARGLQLLRPNGTLSYIVSDTWRTIKSHKPLRKRILENTTVFHILDLPSWIFDATVNTCILTLQKASPPEDHKLIAGDLRAIEKDNWKTLSDNLIAVSGHGPDIQTLECARYTYAQNLINIYDNRSFFIGNPILFKLMDNRTSTTIERGGIQMKAIEINGKVGEYLELKSIAEVKKGLATGDNRRFYHREADGRGSYQLVDHSKIMSEEQIASLSEQERLHGVDPARYEEKHLVPLDKGENAEVEMSWLPNYYVRHKFYVDWSQRAVQEIYTLGGMRNPQFQFHKGISFSWTGFYAPTFRLNTGCVFDQSSSCIFQNEYEIELLLAILSSRVAKYITKVFCDHSVNSTASVIERIVLPKPSIENNEDIKNLARRIIEKQRVDPLYDYGHNEQKQIDTLVYLGYGLTDEDIRDVELWYCRRYRALAETQGVLTEVQEKYAGHLARCQRILEKPPSYWRSNPILQLIAQGESHTLEFKETLEFDVRQNQHNPHLNKECLKTIEAFLNTDSGTLLIGVSDSGEIKGLNRDFQYVRGNNCDGFEQKLRNLIRSRLNPAPTGNVQINFEELAEGTVCKVVVQPSGQVVHFDNEVYIRDGNGTRKLEGRTLTDWIQQRKT